MKRAAGYAEQPEKPWDWATVFCLMRESFPALRDPGLLTLDQLLIYVKRLNILLGGGNSNTSKSDSQPAEGHSESLQTESPDDWFAKIVSGEIELTEADGVTAQTPRASSNQRRKPSHDEQAFLSAL